MKLIFQVFTGDLTPQSQVNAEWILQRLEPAYQAGKLAGVLCGWSSDRNLYTELAGQLHAWGVPLYLKLAVFSELRDYAAYDAILDYQDQAAAAYRLNPQESFEFRCPASERNRRVLTDLYEQRFAGLPVDGVFLDRIRYPSFLSGIAGIGGCFCPECVRRYRKAGLDVGELRRCLQRVKEERSLELTAYQEGVWQLADPQLDALMKIKCDIIEEAIASYAQYFHNLGFQVGLDLFTPALGYFCGQNVQKLRQHADFVKPMMYRYTDAPAGLPFELRCLEKAAGSQAAKQFIELAGGEKDWIRQELVWMNQTVGCPVWPGIEANYIEPIACIRPEQIRQNRMMLEELGYERMVASWNLTRIPEDNLRALTE